MTQDGQPRFGFLARFNIGLGHKAPIGPGFSVPWEQASSLQVFERSASEINVGKNPVLDELFLWPTARGAVVFDGRVDAFSGDDAVRAIPNADSRPFSRLVDALVSGNGLSVDLLKRVVGDYAIVHWDEEGRVLRLARDPFGTRSLFYFIADEVVTVSSDLGLLVRNIRGPLELDWIQARAWLMPTTDPVSLLDRTILKGVGRVVPGTILEIAQKGVSGCRFWNPDDVRRFVEGTLDEAVGLLTEAVSRSIADRLPRDDLNFACHLSGGLDCSTICGFIARNHPDKLDRGQFISWTPSVPLERGPSELDVVGRLANAWNIRPTHVGIDALETAYREWNSTPFDPSRNLTMAAAESAGLKSLSQDCAVMLSGWGGDEFASCHGWGLPMELLWNGRWSELGKFLIRTDSNHGWAAVWSSVIRFGRWLVPASAKHILGKFRLAKNPLIGDPFLFRLMDVNYHSSVRSAQTFAYWSGHLVERIEAWAALGRAKSVQYAYPLLDRRVVELALSLPGWYYGDSRESRLVFRRMAGNVWPDGMAASSRKWEPGLAALVNSFSIPPEEVQRAEDGIIGDVLAEPEILGILPRKLRKLVTDEGVRREPAALRPYIYALRQIRDSLRWIRAENEARNVRRRN